MYFFTILNEEKIYCIFCIIQLSFYKVRLLATLTLLPHRQESFVVFMCTVVNR